MTSVLPKAVVLLSGGLDSATVLAIAHRDGFEPYALSFRYGQRHQTELRRAQTISKKMRVAKHTTIDIDLSVWGGSALTDPNLLVPKSDTIDGMSHDIPITYVPARNTIFLSFALGWAEVLGANDIFIGVNALDYSGYPDCRPEFIAAFEQMSNLATKQGVQNKKSTSGQPLKIRTPLIDLTKAEIIRLGLELGVDYSQTLSCYDPVDDELACGHCDACLLRLRGFLQNGIPDPAPYA